ncbi:MAG TPA: hypothetical protein PKC45_12110, partial [Gemmatales bacterium]|nr:hypothetical protein [Gemmatales bacterium]
KHATGGGGGTGVVLSAEEQKAMDKHVRSQARSALSHAKAIGALAFDVNGFLVTPNDYERVKSLIDKGHIAVAYSSDLGGDASYDAGTDTLYIGDQGLWNKDGFYALIIHEATHAAFDAQGLAIADTVSEIAAYVAQMLYYMVRRPDADAPFTGNPLEDAIFRPAWRYAKHFNDKRLKLIKNDVPPPYKDLVKMTEALLAHEVYKEQFEMSENDFGGLAGYNGIGGTFYE